MDPAFSRPGEPPSAFERGLFDQAACDRPSNSQQLWMLIGRQIGLAALVAVLDEFGDTQVWVPSRSALMKALWGDLRDDEIRRCLANGDTWSEISRRLSVSRTTIARAVPLTDGNGTARCGKQRA